LQAVWKTAALLLFRGRIINSLSTAWQAGEGRNGVFFTRGKRNFSIPQEVRDVIFQILGLVRFFSGRNREEIRKKMLIPGNISNYGIVVFAGRENGAASAIFRSFHRRICIKTDTPGEFLGNYQQLIHN
jgi:hypothetical protein